MYSVQLKRAVSIAAYTAIDTVFVDVVATADEIGSWVGLNPTRRAIDNFCLPQFLFETLTKVYGYLKS